MSGMVIVGVLLVVSFLALDALSPLGSFFYQRLSDHLAAPAPPGPRAA